MTHRIVCCTRTRFAYRIVSYTRTRLALWWRCNWLFESHGDVGEQSRKSQLEGQEKKRRGKAEHDDGAKKRRRDKGDDRSGQGGGVGSTAKWGSTAIGTRSCQW